MATFSREFLSAYPASIGGGIGITTTAGTGTTIHTVPSGKKDELWIYAVNNDPTTSHILTLKFPGNDIRTVISPSAGLLLIAPGLMLSAGQTLYANADSGSPAYLVVYGFVNRIT